MFVYKWYDGAALDRQYNNRLHVPDYADYLERWEVQSRETEGVLPVIKDIPYGRLPRERLDIYPASQPGSKTLVFIHGGYWQMLDKALFHFIARAFHAYGITTVLVTYPLAPAASMDGIVLSCRSAVSWLYHHLPAYNGDPQQMYVAGHSAGGHLAAMLLATDWPLFSTGVPANVWKGACLISGLFNLVPIQLSYLNKMLVMDREAAERNSPVRLQPQSAPPVIIAVGAAETEEFNDQSRELYTCWKSKIADIQLLPLHDLHHFSIVDAMADPGSDLHKAICRVMDVH